jgi:hypothetical protein
VVRTAASPLGKQVDDCQIVQGAGIRHGKPGRRCRVLGIERLHEARRAQVTRGQPQ